ncbi:MAG: methionine adenosyltransferase [Gammaproteobacteria bacterium]
MGGFVFTSESVAPGHPDKVADRISDAVLDAALVAADGPAASSVRAAIETLVKNDAVVIAGESRPLIDQSQLRTIAARVIRDIGYDRKDEMFNADSFSLVNLCGLQSGDIAQGVDNAGAGDQGLMFGFACSETAAMMPLPLDLSHRILRRHAEMRQKTQWLRPDAKSQVSVLYENDKPAAANAVVLSTQHDAEIDGIGDAKKRHAIVREMAVEDIIRPVLREAGLQLPAADKLHINPTGAFVKGGPEADCGLTGRKIIVDTYGGAAPHGGGAFSGKDPTKVDRSAAYAARYLAKNIVAAGLAKKCLLQVAYAIGEAQPVSLLVNTFGGGDDDAITKRVRAICGKDGGFDLTPGGIIRHLDLLRPIYEQTAAYGHFGSNPASDSFSWEKTNLADLLRD